MGYWNVPKWIISKACVSVQCISTIYSTYFFIYGFTPVSKDYYWFFKVLTLICENFVTFILKQATSVASAIYLVGWYFRQPFLLGLNNLITTGRGSPVPQVLPMGIYTQPHYYLCFQGNFVPFIGGSVYFASHLTVLTLIFLLNLNLFLCIGLQPASFCLTSYIPILCPSPLIFPCSVSFFSGPLTIHRGWLLGFTLEVSIHILTATFLSIHPH